MSVLVSEYDLLKRARLARAALVAFVLLLTGGPLAEVSAQQRKVEQGKQAVGKSESKAASGKQIVSETIRKIDYQWLPDRQETVFEFKERARHRVFGFAVNTNGDWLLLVPTRYFKYELASEGATLWRSSDRGKSWSKVTDLPEDLPEFARLKSTYILTLSKLSVTRQGRIIVYAEHWPRKYPTVPGWLPHPKKGRLGENPPGRPLRAGRAYFYDGVQFSMMYSDDGGESWQVTDVVDGSPLHNLSSSACGEMFHETPDGDLTLGVRGWLKEGATYGWTEATGYIRSSDGGLTWSEPQIIFKGDDLLGQWYNETVVLPRTSGPWVAIARMNPLYRLGKPTGHGFLGGYRSFSYDQGNTWTMPEPFTDAIAYPGLVDLRDGGILHSAGAGPASMRISYDNGLSWAYSMQLPLVGGAGSPWIQPDEDTLVVVHNDITEHKLQLTYLTRQPTSKNLTTQPVTHPEHRWTMRDLKNLYIDKSLKPFSRSAYCGDGTIVVAGVTGGTSQQVIAVTTPDPLLTWSAPMTVAEPKKFREYLSGVFDGHRKKRADDDLPGKRRTRAQNQRRSQAGQYAGITKDVDFQRFGEELARGECYRINRRDKQSSARFAVFA